MNANELLIYLTRKQLTAIFEAARALPADKLDWQPAPGARSALDQLQEFATALSRFGNAWTERKIEFNPEQFAEWKADRSKLTDIDELEKVATEQTEQFITFLQSVKPEDYNLPVEMPFPGEFKMADVLSYHYWNGAYHQGQILYIGNLLEDGN